jgi:hypothetical protein
MDIINAVLGFDWGAIVNILLQAIGLAALVATVTPTDADDRIIAAIQRAVHTLAGNWGKSANK